MQPPFWEPHQNAIAQAVKEVEAEVKPAGVRFIHYDIAKDWYGDWGLFFRILLLDSATRGKRFDQITKGVTEMIRERLPERVYGLMHYWSFRSESEQEELQDASWK